jgi:D-beta-D-heptose 7-phosphate kinase/D-beta-D-heptose 1-phosphate adenosyltransferase
MKKFAASNSARVLVIGDLILDRYVQGDTERISPEAPVPVVKVHETGEKPGGAANVAANIRTLGVAVKLLGITGEDHAADRLTALLRDYGIEHHLVRQPGYSTITKQRIISRHQQLLRLDYEAQAPAVAVQRLGDLFANRIAEVDTVVFSDYAKGSLSSVSELIAQARDRGIRILVDPKGNDFNRYRYANILTPNLREFESVVGPCGDEHELIDRGLSLGRDLDLDALCITRGEHGITLIDLRAARARQFPVQSREVYDVTGAGDTFIATLAAAVSSGYTLEPALEFANQAAGLVVERLGTACLTAAELNQAVNGARGRPGIVSREELQQLVAVARNRGERIVMTNGCFDILHAGHVYYLEQARAMGDRLIIAVNDDASVTRLKGAGRPVNSLQQRMEVLAGLAAIDWIIPFSEDTPADLIDQLRPDVLVKGGDYRVEQIAGARSVTEHGGRVSIIPYRHDNSTSALIQSIQEISK